MSEAQFRMLTVHMTGHGEYELSIDQYHGSAMEDGIARVIASVKLTIKRDSFLVEDIFVDKEATVEEIRDIEHAIWTLYRDQHSRLYPDQEE